MSSDGPTPTPLLDGGDFLLFLLLALWTTVGVVLLIGDGPSGLFFNIMGGLLLAGVIVFIVTTVRGIVLALRIRNAAPESMGGVDGTTQHLS
ncbi:hypothetical protein [Frondihabitans cladoniiphilus]|uniref:Uncharacterized protein n=1 Tax=Frondihabitans cladoniiphilus TaxID=715785 RepID=A0ABP8VKE5_9MICO